MFLSKLNDSLGILANVGILVGLVFVGMEYRNNTSLIQIEADSNVGSRINDIVNLVV